MAIVFNPEKSDKKLSQIIEENKPKTVCLIFIHGMGDLVMFLNPFHALKEKYPEINFTLGLQKGLSFEDIIPDADLEICSSLDKLEGTNYDLVGLVHFPMSEGQQEFTKGEWCCIHELGIDPVGGHRLIKPVPNRLIGLHFNITCLPDSCNPDYETAKTIWQEVIDAGFLPIETHFQHAFHNPVNEKFDFIGCSVRGAHAKISSLIGLTNSLCGSICVVSGNFHMSLAMLPSNRIFFLEKHFKLECFTHLPVARASIKPGEYQKGTVTKWLETLK